MKNKLVLTVGNGMMGDDAAGALLAIIIEKYPLEQWDVINGGAAPENHVHRIREMAPERVLIVDAADMDLPAGAVRRIGAERIADPFLLTTHSLPLTFLIQALQEFVPQVDMLGIQPEIVAFGYPMSAPVKRAVEEIYASLKNGAEAWESL
ncbi:MAG: hydrogenase maturation peptidase HycI [Chloroflexota bacterium]